MLSVLWPRYIFPFFFMVPVPGLGDTRHKVRFGHLRSGKARQGKARRKAMPMEGWAARAHASTTFGLMGDGGTVVLGTGYWVYWGRARNMEAGKGKKRLDQARQGMGVRLLARHFLAGNRAVGWARHLVVGMDAVIISGPRPYHAPCMPSGPFSFLRYRKALREEPWLGMEGHGR